MVSLLEDLLARLDMKTVTETTVESLKPEAATQLMPIASENISPMELLTALLEGNAEELKSLIGQTDESQLPAALKGFMEKIQELLGKMSSNLEVKAGDKDLIMEAAGNEVSREELISQLKAQVRDVVEKLKVRIFEHKTAQPQGIVTDEAQISVSNFSESTQTNSENGADASKHEAKSELKSEDKVSETNGKTTQTATSQETVQRNQSVENKTAGEFAIPSEQKSPETANVRIEKTTLPLSEKPLAQTVTNQVTMKVKLMAGENKQEMEMHLKPESLGKLSLKIIHERGEILARITAENEQVKGILESNMQLLKDALEKSGLTVQSLSVFVGNGQEKNQSRQDLNGNYRSNERGLSESFKSSSTVETLNERARVRDFYDQSSQINLTA
jgi:flagellar hook-length control protein FliK